MHLDKLINRKPYEKIEYKLRRHPMTFVPNIIVFFILLLAPIGLYFMTQNLFPGLLATNTISGLVIVFGTIYFLSCYLFFYSHFIDYYLDIWIVTNDRIVDIVQQGLFSRSVTELDLYQIQDITTEIKGIIPTLFHYGNITVKTASNNNGIVFYEVHSPNKIREHLILLAQEDRKFHPVGTVASLPRI